MNSNRLLLIVTLALGILIGFASPSFATPRPVRIAVVAATGSGTEQQVVDSLSSQLQEDGNIVLSTVNPDWLVTCRIEDHTDIAALTVRVNGTITIKTAAGENVLNTISAQANKQDFSTGAPTPLNKALVTSAMREVVQELSQRAVRPIEDAVVTEIDVREKLASAHVLYDADKYDDALATVMLITRDSPHFWPAHNLADQIKMEKEALSLVTQAKASARQGQHRQAIADLRQVSSKSKRYKTAQGLIATYSRPTLEKSKSKPAVSQQAVSNAQLKALEAEKRSLEARRQAIEAQEAALRSK